MKHVVKQAFLLLGIAAAPLLAQDLVIPPTTTQDGYEVTTTRTSYTQLGGGEPMQGSTSTTTEISSTAVNDSYDEDGDEYPGYRSWTHVSISSSPHMVELAGATVSDGAAPPLVPDPNGDPDIPPPPYPETPEGYYDPTVGNTPGTPQSTTPATPETQSSPDAQQSTLDAASVADATTAGDPVVMATGEYLMTEVDERFGPASLPLVLSRTYGSERTGRGRILGDTWLSSLESRAVRTHSSTADIDATLAVIDADILSAQTDLNALTSAFKSGMAEIRPVFLTLNPVYQNYQRAHAALTQAATQYAAGTYVGDAIRRELTSLQAEWAAISPKWLALQANFSFWFRSGIDQAAVVGLLADMNANWTAIRQGYLDVVPEGALSAIEAKITGWNAVRGDWSDQRKAAVASSALTASVDYGLGQFAQAGNNWILIVDEEGIPHPYVIPDTVLPDYQSQTRYAGTDVINYYAHIGSGVELVARYPTKDHAWLRADGSVERRTEEGMTFLYRATGQLERTSDRSGNSITYTYDSSGRLTTATDSFGRTMLFHFTDDRLTSVDLPENRRVDYGYQTATGEFDGRLHTVSMYKLTDPVQERAVVRYDYEGDLLVTITKPDLTTRSYQYETRTYNGQTKVVLTSDTDEENETETFDYSPSSHTVTHRTASGVETAYTFDGQNRQTRVDYGDQTFEETTYYGESTDIQSYRDRAGRLTTYGPYTDHDPSNVTLPGDLTATWLWSQSFPHQVGTYTDPTQRTTTYLYDASGNLGLIGYADGTSEVFDRSGGAHGLVRSYTDREGNTITYDYDTYGFVSRITYPDETRSSESFVNDAYGNVLSRTLATGGEIAFTYNVDDRVTSATYREADGSLSTETYVYSNRKDLVEQHFRDGTHLYYRYDARHLLKEIAREPFSAEPKERTVLEYRADGRPMERKVYDRTGALAYHETYQYDGAGRQRSRTIERTDGEPDITTSVELDGLDRPVRLTDARGNQTEMRYETHGGVGAIRFPSDGVNGPTERSFHYDSLGRLVETVDEDHKSMQYQDFDPNNYPRTIRDGSPAAAVLSYNSRGQALTSARGRQSRMATFDFRGNLLTQTDGGPGNPAATYLYNGNGQIERYTDRDGVVRRFEYDAYGNLTEEYLNDTLQRAYAYEKGHLSAVTTTKAGVSSTVSYTYDYAGRLETVTDPYQHTFSYTYTALGDVETVTDPNDNTIRYLYDRAGRLTDVETPEGIRRRLEYDEAGNVTREVSWPGKDTSYVYDSRNRLFSQESPGGPKTVYQYDGVGHLRRETVGDAAPYMWSYDPLRGLLETETNQLGSVKSYLYSDEGWLETKTDFTGVVTDYGYDDLGRLKDSVASDGTTKSYAYTAEGSLTSASTPDTAVSFTYYPNGRLESVTDNVSGVVISYGYDEVGNLTQEVRTGFKTGTSSSETHTIAYAYGAMDELEEVTDWTGGVTSYGYDALLNRTSEMLPDGVVTTTTYDRASRVTGIVSRASDGSVIQGEAYGYTVEGQRAYTLDRSGKYTLYGYDGAGRIEKVQYPWSFVASVEDNRGSYGWGRGGRVWVDYADVDWSTYERMQDDYEAYFEGSWQGVSRWQPSWTVSYTYNSLGLKDKETSPAGSLSYEYDEAFRLTQAGRRSYTYDEAGNMIAETVKRFEEPEEEETDGGPLACVSGGHGGSWHSPWGHSWGQGNSWDWVDWGWWGGWNGWGGNDDTPGWDAPLVSDYRSYRYDADNRLIQVQQELANGASTIIDYTLDALGREVGRRERRTNPLDHSLPTSTTWTVYEGMGYTEALSLGVMRALPTGEGIQGLRKARESDAGRYMRPGTGDEISPELSTLRSENLVGPGRAPVFTQYEDGIDYYLTDILGSVRALVGESGQVSHRANYDVYGVPLRPDGEPLGYGYLGKPVDPVSHLVRTDHRPYDPVVGYFHTLDPLQVGTQNLWQAYVGFDPVNFIDPWGLSPSDNVVAPSVTPYYQGPVPYIGSFPSTGSNLGDRLLSIGAGAVNMLAGVVNYPFALLGAADTAITVVDEAVPDELSLTGQGLRADLEIAGAAAVVLAPEMALARTTVSLLTAPTATTGGAAGTATNTVYRSVNEAGQVQYVGITNNLARRAAEHLTDKGIQVEKVMTGLSRSDARAIEQALIEVHGLAKEGGSLMNKINSIAATNPQYAEQLRRGYQLLQGAGYR